MRKVAVLVHKVILVVFLSAASTEPVRPVYSAVPSSTRQDYYHRNRRLVLHEDINKLSNYMLQSLYLEFNTGRLNFRLGHYNLIMVRILPNVVVRNSCILNNCKVPLQ
jgi:hypothetical protein